MGVDTSRWSHLADFVGHSIDALSCFHYRVHFYLHNDRNIRTSILLIVGITKALHRLERTMNLLCH